MASYGSHVALLSRVIDYAGIFPPAALPLKDALCKAATFRSTAKQPWLMGRITLPWEEIKKITAKQLFESGANGSPWNFTALAAPLQGLTGTDLVRAIEWELREIGRWNERWQTSSLPMSIVGYEIKLPFELTHKSSATTVAEVLNPALERFASVAGGGITPYFEVSFEANWKDGVRSTCRALADWAHEDSDSGIIPGVKFRTGGALVPSAEQLAEAVVATTNHQLRFKATQGLHHPFSKGKDFGFINLFAALALAQSFGESEFGISETATCLIASGDQFQFETDKFVWGKRTLLTEEIEKARRIYAGTFGSCSVDEPDQYLFEEVK